MATIIIRKLLEMAGRAFALREAVEVDLHFVLELRRHVRGAVHVEADEGAHQAEVARIQVRHLAKGTDDIFGKSTCSSPSQAPNEEVKRLPF